MCISIHCSQIFQYLEPSTGPTVSLEVLKMQIMGQIARSGIKWQVLKFVRAGN